MKINAKFLTSKEKFLSVLEGKLDSKSDKLLKSLIDILALNNGENDINLDLLDIQTVLSAGDEVFVGVIQDDKNELFKKMIDDIKDVKSAMVYFAVNEDYPFLKIQDYMSLLEEKVDENGDIILGTSVDNSLKDNESLIILILVS